MIGHLRLVDLIAEGGMGTVYKAVDERLDRTLAVKAIRSAREVDPEARARFLREAKILSQLDHPNICQLYDYIEDEETDFLVLELVTGHSLRQVLDDGLEKTQKLSIAQQLLAVLAAVHGQGVIHRDLKPENVMVTPAGDVKVLDFGLARPAAGTDHRKVSAETSSLDAQSPGDTETVGPTQVLADTRLGTVVGTAAYMSPEQARGERATPASDIYSLGLIFQEMFTGKRPYPPDLDAEELQKLAIWGETVAIDGLSPDLKGLINRMKSLAPGSRPSALDAADILNRIVDRPRRRRRIAVVAAVFVLLALFAGGMSLQFIRAERASRIAAEEATTSQLVVDTLVGLFRVADPYTQEDQDLSAAEIVHRGAVRIDEQLADRPLLQARLKHVIGEVYGGLGLYLDSVTQLEAALQTRMDIQGEDSVEGAQTMALLGEVYRQTGDLERCEQLARRSLIILATKLPETDPLLGQVRTSLGSCIQGQGRTTEALPIFQEAYALLSTTLGDDDPRTLRTGVSLAASLRASGELDEAETLLRALIAKLKRVLGPANMEVARALNNLAYLLRTRKDFVGAETSYREALEIQAHHLPLHHPDRIRVLQNLTAVLFYQGRLDETEETLRRIVELRRQAHPEAHTTLASALVNGLGRFLLDEGRYLEARPALTEGLGVYEAVLGSDHVRTAVARGSLGVAFLGAGRLEEGQRIIAESLALLEARSEIEYAARSSVKHLARHLSEAGHPDLAARYLSLLESQGPKGP